jgi:hypothetical protein
MSATTARIQVGRGNVWAEEAPRTMRTKTMKSVKHARKNNRHRYVESGQREN